MIKGEKWIRQTRNRPGDREERKKNLSVYMPIRSCLWYNVCKTDIIPSRIWFLRSPQKTRRPIPPEGYHVWRTWYNVCKADIIPWRIWFSRSPRKSRRSNLPEGYHVRRTWYNENTMQMEKGAAMDRYSGRLWAVLRNERNILVAEETTSAGRCGFTSAAFSCPAPACP